MDEELQIVSQQNTKKDIAHKSVHLSNVLARHLLFDEMESDAIVTSDESVSLVRDVPVMSRKVLLTLFWLMAQVTGEDEALKTVEVPLSELAKELDMPLDSGEDYRLWINIVRSCASKVFCRYNQQTGWIDWVGLFDRDECGYNPTEHLVSLRLGKKMMPYLLRLKDNQTIYKFGYLKQLPTNYAILLYVFFSSMKGAYSFVVSLDLLKTILKRRDDDTKRFISRYLIPAIFDINEFTDLTIKARRVLDKNHRITDFEFFVYEKNSDEKEELQIGPDRPLRPSTLLMSMSEKRKSIMLEDSDGRVRAKQLRV